MDFDDIKESLAFLDDWEDRYKFVIDLGNQLEPLPPEHHVRDNKVEGCVSQVWLVFEPAEDGKINIYGDSDAMIVKGLVAIVIALFTGKSAQEMLAIDALDILNDIGLSEHLTSQRANGLRSMIDWVYAAAKKAAA